MKKHGPSLKLPQYRFLFADREILEEISRISFTYLTKHFSQKSDKIEKNFVNIIKLFGITELKTKPTVTINPKILEDLRILDQYNAEISGEELFSIKDPEIQTIL